jgi:hypothetical protein
LNSPTKSFSILNLFKTDFLPSYSINNKSKEPLLSFILNSSYYYGNGDNMFYEWARNKLSLYFISINETPLSSLMNKYGNVSKSKFGIALIHIGPFKLPYAIGIFSRTNFCNLSTIWILLSPSIHTAN